MAITIATTVMIPANARDANTGWPAKSGGNVSPLTPERLISVPMAMATSHNTTQVQINHFGTILISSRKRNRSLFLRNRISFMRSSNASLMLSSFVPARLVRLLKESFCLARLRHTFIGKRSPRGDHRGNAPPQDEARLQQKLWRAGFLAEPLDPAPDPGRGADTEGPGHRGDGPYEFLRRFFFAKFFGAHAHEKLRAAGEVGGQIEMYGPQRGERFAKLGLFGAAGFAFGQMCLEPLFVVGRNRFHVLLRDQFFCAFVYLFVH